MEQVRSNSFRLPKITLFILPLFLFGCQNKYFEQDLNKVLNVEKVEIKNSQQIDEWGGNQGDGFILEVYELSEQTIQSFLNVTSKNLPDKEHDKHWQKYNWNVTPFDSSYNEIIIMTLNYSSENKKLKYQLDEIKSLLKKKGVYYSFYYRPNKDNPNNAQLFILDVQSRKLRTIEQQL